MSERAALLAAILADPADDLARLVYADWLEETAQPAAVARARFIRLQIELAGSDLANVEFPRRDFAIADEIDALAARWMRAWLKELPAPVAGAVWKQGRGANAFRRGFLDGVELPAKVFLAAAPRLMAAAPITALRFHGGYRDTVKLFDCPHFRKLRSVRLSGDWEGNRIARRLAKCTDLGTIRELDLSRCRLRAFGADDLAGAAALGQLSVLRLRYNWLYESSVAQLARSPTLAALTQLDVTGNPGVRQWAAPDRRRFGGKLVF